MVHTVSPLRMGAMWLIWTPTLPAGCLPPTAWTIAFSTLWNGLLFQTALFTVRWTPPSVSLPRAFTPAWMSARRSPRVNSVSAASGAVLKVETKMAFGRRSGSAWMP